MKRLTKLTTEKVGPKLWRLTAPLIFWHKGRFYTVPTGFLTDGASTPRVLWSLCPPMSGYTAEAAVLHDWLYSLDCPISMSRGSADYLFYVAMRDLKVNPTRARAIHIGVRTGGSESFRVKHSYQKLTEDTAYMGEYIK